MKFVRTGGRKKSYSEKLYAFLLNMFLIKSVFFIFLNTSFKTIYKIFE